MLSAGRTSMPSTLPATPSIFQVLVTAFLLVSTIDTVLSPVSAATSAACTAEGPSRTAANTAGMVWSFMAVSLGIPSLNGDHSGYGRASRMDAGGGRKRIVSG